MAISSIVQSRNAPPEAVKITLSIELTFSPCSAWKIAECSLSTGISLHLFLEAFCFTRSPAATILSLFASAKSAPFSSAINPGSRPAAPTMAENARSHFLEALSSSASLPVPILI